MEKVFYKQVSGEIMSGEKCDILEFVDDLRNNRNADNILYNEDNGLIVFLITDEEHRKFYTDDILNIEQYIKKDVHAWYYCYRIETSEDVVELSISCKIFE